jgi:hypothetical protein
VIFDYLCDFDTLPSVLPSCRIGGFPTWPEAYRYQGNYWQVDIENAEEVGYIIRENGGQLVIELESYPNNDYASKVIMGVVKGMYAWAQEQDPAKRLPALVALDEAQQFLPQNLQDAEDKETTQELLRTFKRLNEIGRHYGLTPALFTQRAARINKDVIGGTEIYVLMRQTMPQDLKVCEDVLGKENVDRQQLASFKNGDALVFEGGQSFKVHFDLRQSEHKSSNPDPEKAIARYQERKVQKTLSVSQSPRSGETQPQKEGMEDLPANPRLATEIVEKKDETPLLARGVNAYKEGATTQPRLAAVLDISAWDARNLMPKIEAEIARLEASEQN